MRLSTWWRRHGVALVTIANTIIIGFLGVDGLIAEAHKPYWIAAGIVFGAIGTQLGYSKSGVETMKAPRIVGAIALALILFAVCGVNIAKADTVTITWSNPITNTDTSSIPASGPGSLQSWRFEYGTCSAPNVFGAKVGEFPRTRAANGPALTSTTNNFDPGTTCIRGYVSNTYGVESLVSNVTSKTVTPPQPGPILLTTVGPQVYDVRPNEQTFAFDRGRQVGTVKLGLQCDENRNTDANWYALERPSSARLTRAPRSTALVARCG